MSVSEETEITGDGAVKLLIHHGTQELEYSEIIKITNMKRMSLDTNKDWII